MEQLVEEDEFMRVHAPVASSQKKNVYCGTCDKQFANQANLNRHEELKHTDQNTPEAVAKCLQLKEYRKINRRERRVNDPVYREKVQQTNRAYKLKIKTRGAAEDGDHAGDVSNDVKPKDGSVSVDVSEVTQLDEDDGRMCDVSKRAKTHHKGGKTTDGLHVTTMALTNENIAEFFLPRWSAPRTRVQRLAAPRSSVV
jgi:hypothetical protein